MVKTQITFFKVQRSWVAIFCLLIVTIIDWDYLKVIWEEYTEVWSWHLLRQSTATRQKYLTNYYIGKTSVEYWSDYLGANN